MAEGERLSALVDKLLDLSRLEAGRAVPRREWTSLEEVLLAARDALPPGPGRITVSVEPDLPAVHADAAQLERAFANLLENARRYSGDLPVSVLARVSGAAVVVRVADHGPGIPPPSRRGSSSPSIAAAATGSVRGRAPASGSRSPEAS